MENKYLSSLAAALFACVMLPVLSDGQLTVQTSYTSVACHGQSDGGASVTPGGGASPYTYSWSPGGGTDSVAAGLTAGTYTVIVTDNSGATASDSITISQPGALRVHAPVTSGLCSVGDLGSATETPGRGTAPYTYLWSDGSSQTAATATGLSAGTYTVTVQDSCGASGTASVVITQPAALTAAPRVINGTSECSNAGSGIVNVKAHGGNAPYTYLWSDGSSQSTATATGLSAGTYSVTITDQCGNSATASVTVTQDAALGVTTYTVDSTGVAAVTASGGRRPYFYSWSPGGQNVDTIEGLTAGTYTCTITDINGCSETTTVSITPTGINNLTARSASITFYPNPGTGQFTIKLSGVSGRLVMVEVYNMLGEKVYSATLHVRTTQPGGQVQDGSTIDISNQPNGVYLYRILTESGGLAGEGKLIIQK